MITSILSSTPSKTNLDALLVLVPAFKSPSAPWKDLEPELAALCSTADPQKTFTGKAGTSLIFPTLEKIAPGLLALTGIGEDPDPLSIQKSIGKTVRLLQQKKIKTLGVILLSKTISLDSIVLAVEEGSYRFTEYTPEPLDAPSPISKLIFFKKGGHSDPSMEKASKIAEAIRYTRNVANQPPNFFYPEKLAQEALRLSKHRGLKCEVFYADRLKKEGFGGILAVGQGSHNNPCFIRMDYKGGRKNDPPYVLVGKAITFDTGGISIKPSDKMDEMKFDKCGGITVLGVMEAISALKLPLNVTGLISSAENMPSSKAYRPGDLVKTLSGKFVEILNTDAEGRVVLADALTYACKMKPKAVVDLATLTGACIICFGHECAAILGNNQSLIQQIQNASEKTGEKIWQLPLWKEYQEKVKSDIAYVRNSTGREGGTITAACFLNAFVDEKIPWAHLDIAGMAWTSHEEGHRAKGATAFGVRLLTQWLQTRQH